MSRLLDVVEIVHPSKGLERIGDGDEIASKGVAISMEEIVERRVASLEQLVGIHCFERGSHLVEFIEDVVDERFGER
ncbi:hypothetical protein Nmn1133_13080 [Halosegnis longus]|uniref:Uncharacterized protein n=1 Tax=Halosegnis longus TaxID=2216012 RepID=A0AAJ4R5G1_9EURY|nr:hypothetical protein Nmn1133_13080 [Salella cibi]